MTSSALAGYIYLITNLVNGKKYVGCTTSTVEQRWVRHLSQVRSKRKFALHRAINQYGPHNFSVETLETVYGSLEDLFAAEVSQIHSSKCLAPIGYNLTVGGDGISLLSPGAEKRRREAYAIAMKKMHADPSWLAAISSASRERSKRPSWRKATVEAGHRRAQDPEWQKANAAKNALVHSDPKYLEVMRGLPQDPDWRRAQLEGVRRSSSSIEWKEKNAMALAATRTARLTKIREAYEALPPEERTAKEQSRLDKRREYSRLYQRDKRARKAQESKDLNP